ncbi:MAG TPA: hypothetical protein VFL64_10130 [Rhizobacter sp.]|nr:hypothetical protein [Rhizobacter sp.]
MQNPATHKPPARKAREPEFPGKLDKAPDFEACHLAFTESARRTQAPLRRLDQKR